MCGGSIRMEGAGDCAEVHYVWPRPLPVTLQSYGLLLVRASFHSCVPQLQQGSAQSPLLPT